MDEHREQKSWGTLIFRSADKRECRRENAAEVRVKGHHYTDDIWWPWPESENIIKMIEQVGVGAYSMGRKDARSLVRSALGIIDDSDYDGKDYVRLE